MFKKSTPLELIKKEEDLRFKYTQPGEFANSNHPEVISFAHDVIKNLSNEHEITISLYNAVRDQFAYNPYHLDTSKEGLKANHILKLGFGFCIPKATFLVACLRAAGVPARIGFADVKNHLTSKRLSNLLGTNLFFFHGYADIYLNGKWVKATPAFNIELCNKAGIKPLDFDGYNSSLFHEYDIQGRMHMEYVKQRGEFFDIPYEDLINCWKEHYPMLKNIGGITELNGNFNNEIIKTN